MRALIDVILSEKGHFFSPQGSIIQNQDEHLVAYGEPGYTNRRKPGRC
jgi:hypothetical protein